MKQPRDFSLQGAIDLGARQAAAQRRQRVAEQVAGNGGQPGGPPGGVVIDVTDETFNTDVVERSKSVPVILDLWAEWCGPCKQLSPVLERLATEADGAFVLAKVDVDANPQLSAALQVQSIPMVHAVIDGQLVPGFLGVQPEQQIRQWIAQLLEAARQMGLPGAGDGPAVGGEDGQADETGAPGAMGGGLGDIYADAQEAMQRGDLDAAAAAFEKVLEGSPGDPVAAMGLGQVALIRRVESYDQAAVRRAADAEPANAGAQAKAADVELATGQIDDAFSRLLDTIRRTAGPERDVARKHLISLFEIFPPKDPRVTKARAALSSLLF